MNKRVVTSLLLVALFLMCWVAPYSGGEMLQHAGLQVDTANSTTGTVVDAGPLSEGNSSSYSVHNLNTSEQFSSIQEAIDAPNTTDGHVIEVDPGNYTENIMVNKSLTILSSSGDPSTTIIHAENTSENVFSVTADQVTLSGFTIEGAVENEKAGIYLGSSHNVIAKNILSSNYYGVVAVNSVGNTLNNNLIESNIKRGIYLESSEKNILTNNTVHFNHASGGISLRGTSSNNIITNNIAESNSGYGIILVHSNDNNSIKNNALNFNGYSGIDVRGTSSRNTIENNIITENQASGITLRQWTNNNYLNNNTLSNNSYNGIEFDEFTNNNTITNNTASNNIFSGVGLFDYSSDNIVSQNELLFNRYGLSMYGTDGNACNNIITNNTMVNNHFQGIWLFNVGDNTIAHNAVSNNTYFGIGASFSSNIAISSNVATGNEQGIGLLFSENITVMDNIANENGLSGIYVWASENNTISNNSLNSNIFEGFYLLESSYNTVSNNFVSASYFGGSLYNASNNTIANNDAESCYYSEVWLYCSPDNTIINDSYYIQEDIIYGTSISISESATSSLQAVTNEINATYNIKVRNLGNVPDEFRLNVSSSDAPEILFLDTSSLTLGPHDVWAGITLSVGDSEPGIYRATVDACSLSDPTTVKDSVETWTVVCGVVGPEPDLTSTITDSAIINCSADGLTSSISGSSIDRSAITDSTITDSTVTRSVITNSIVVDTILPPRVTLTNARVNAGIISEGTLTIDGVTYTIDSDQRLDEFLIGSDYRDSNLLGFTDARTLYVTATESDVGFDISAKDDYSAGSLRVQRATLPPTGVHELTNSIGGYVWANVSENVANSTEWVIITVSYDPNELEGLEENSLTLRYYNDSSRDWEVMPVGGVNLTGHYVWANSSHYSVFSVSGTVTPKRDKRSGGGSASLDSDGDGLSTLQELMMGTDQNNNDTDGDGYDDGIDPFPLDPTLPVPPTPTMTPGLAPTPAVTLAPPTLPPPRASPTPTAAEVGAGFEFPVPGYEAILALGCFVIVAYIIRWRRH